MNTENKEIAVTVYKFISEAGDRRSRDYKTLSNHYDSLCTKDDSGRYMETPKAKEFGNMDKQAALDYINHFNNSTTQQTESEKICQNTNDFFAGAWFKWRGKPFETKGFDVVHGTVTAQFEDYSILEINLWEVEPILLFDSMLPSFGLENKGGNMWKFKHYYFVKNKKEGYDTFTGNIKHIHELQRIMISIKESGVIYKSDILNQVRLYPDF